MSALRIALLRFVLETPSELEEELKKKKANCSQQQESLKGVETQLIAKVKSVEEQLVDIQKQVRFLCTALFRRGKESSA